MHKTIKLEIDNTNLPQVWLRGANLIGGQVINGFHGMRAMCSRFMSMGLENNMAEIVAKDVSE